jgi:hypothetical protein
MKYFFTYEDLYKALCSTAQQLAAATQYTRDKVLQALVNNNNNNDQPPTVTEDELETGMDAISRIPDTVVFPQAIAELMGFKKLIEKDWDRDDETIFHYNPALG